MIHTALFHPTLTQRVEGVNVYADGSQVPQGEVVITNWGTVGPPPFDGAEMRQSSGVLFWHDTRTLTDAKAARVALMREARDAAINGTFTWDGSGFDADQVSQTRILGLKVASTEAGFTGQAWRLANNTWRTLSAADAAGVWTALQTHVAGHFTTFASRDAAIAAATTVAVVDAITWA